MRKNLPVTTVEYPISEETLIVSRTDLKGKLAYFNEDFIDAAGFTGLPGGSRYREGSGLAPVAGSTAEHAWARRLKRDGLLQDTNDNASDFVFVATDAATYSGRAAILGAGGPQKATSEITRPDDFTYTVLDPLAPANAAPNYVRNGADRGTNKALGTVEFRLKFTNTSGHPVTRLRLRIVDVTTTGSPLVVPAPQAELRALDATDQSVTITGGGSVPVKGAVLETVPAQAMGGGLGSAFTVNLGGGLPAGNTLNVAVLFGVQVKGNFETYLIWEALP